MFDSNQITEVLQKAGYRVTEPRLKVLEILGESKKPLNAYEICEKTKSNLDVSTVYRILEVFKKLKVLHFVKDKKGYILCQESECKNDKHCHHQFVCQKCEETTEMHLDDQEFLKSIEDKFKDVLFASHYFEFSGVCGNCRKNN
ncbi:MAG: Fur family transcriptional regulator [Patescibacteria group bacterium]